MTKRLEILLTNHFEKIVTAKRLNAWIDKQSNISLKIPKFKGQVDNQLNEI